MVLYGLPFALIWRCNKNYSTPSRNIPSRTTFQEMQLMNKPIFILGTDNVAINVVQTMAGYFLEIAMVIFTNLPIRQNQRGLEKMQKSESFTKHYLPSVLKLQVQTFLK
uniref:Uncharacterized protein n=1 Tax=Glossina palpalis gambiensis TaxID=67801 RepID=A0A1B0BQJ4_9MUSC